MEINNSLLRALLHKCLTDEALLKEAYEKEEYGPFSIKKELYQFEVPVFRRISCHGNREILEKNDLDYNSIYEIFPEGYSYSLEIKFEDKPSLKLFFNFKKTLNTVQKTEGFRLYHTFLGLRQYEIKFVTETYTPVFTLSHGAIECDLTKGEADEFFDLYRNNLKRVSEQIDLEILKQRVGNYRI